MERARLILSWFLNCLGTALLMLTPMLVPESQLLAASLEAAGCAGCDNGCKGPKPCSTGKNACSATTKDGCDACGCQEDPLDLNKCICKQ
jgi:hypothetical protein